jgi:hypothetical protein
MELLSCTDGTPTRKHFINQVNNCQNTPNKMQTEKSSYKSKSSIPLALIPSATIGKMSLKKDEQPIYRNNGMVMNKEVQSYPQQVIMTPTSRVVESGKATRISNAMQLISNSAPTPIPQIVQIATPTIQPTPKSRETGAKNRVDTNKKLIAHNRQHRNSHPANVVKEGEVQILNIGH